MFLLRAIPLFLAGSVLALAGFGCKKSTTYGSPPKQANVRTEDAGTAKGDATEKRIKSEAESSAMDDVKRAVQNLSQVKSFRAQLILPTSEGAATGEISYQKEQGFHGVLRFPGPVVTELYALGSELWFRTDDAAWTNLKGTPQGAETAATFRGAFTFGDVTSTLFLENLRLTETSMDRDGCKRYVFERRTKRGDETTHVCVANQLPVYIANVSPSAHFEIRYRDFNKQIDLGKPSVK